MSDLLEMSEEELQEIEFNHPSSLDDLVVNSKLPPDRLAEVFVKHPTLQETILKYADPLELYNSVHDNQVFNADPHKFENYDEYKAVLEEYVVALNKIKNYAMQDPNYEETPFANTVRYDKGMFIDYNDQASDIRTAKMDEILRKKEAELAKEEKNTDE